MAGPNLAGCAVFPLTAIFNQRIDDPARFLTYAASRAFHADWGGSEDQQAWGNYYGIPDNVVVVDTAVITGDGRFRADSLQAAG